MHSPDNFMDMVGPDGEINDKSIVTLLQERYCLDQFHTRVGCTNLIAINPHKRVFVPSHKSYDLERICKVQEATEPHPFDIGSAAYLHMVRSCEDQVILSCGESGSGKTETLRQVLQQIVHLSQQTDPQTQIHNDIINADIILECFGNAETFQNKNSTRYSRYTEVRFNDDGTIVGSRIVDYLFENSRVSKCPEDEHNFHVLYMMLATATKDDRAKWQLHTAETKAYQFLRSESAIHDKSNSPALPTMEVLKANLKQLGFSRKSVADIFATLAGILHLGNIEFTMEEQGKGYGAYVKNRHELEIAAKLFNVNTDKLEAALTTSTYLDEDVICSAFLDVDKSKEAKNTLAAVIYQLVFKWVIEQINLYLGSQRLGGSFVTQIGLLDVAGFEDRTPKPNGFDQFMANYTNEKLQAFVIKRAVNSIPVAIESDGIQVSNLVPALPFHLEIIPFFDTPQVGMFDLIDKETYTHGEKARDSTCLAMFEINHGNGKSKFYESGTGGWSTFRIRHYTGKLVSYNVNGFVSKNRNNVYADVIHLFGVTLGSTMGKQKPKSFIASLFTDSVVKAVMHPKDGTAMVGARPAAPQGPSHASDGTRKSSSSMILSSNSLAMSTSIGSSMALSSKPNKKQKGASSQQISALSSLRQSVDTLLEAIEEMRSWTILCIKPNHELAPEKFDFKFIQEQLEALRVKEIVQASRIEFTAGIEFDPFAERFEKLHADVGVSGLDASEKCQKLVELEGWTGQEAQCGNSRIFLTEPVWRGLELRLDALIGDDEDFEGRKIYLVYDDKGIQKTPGCIKKSLASLVENEESDFKSNVAGQMDVKIPIDTDGLSHDKKASEKMKSVSSLRAAKEKQEDAEEKALKKEARKCCAKKPKPPKEKMSKNRRNWVYFTWGVTWWIPDIVIEKVYKADQPGTKMAWREKVAICFIVAFLSGIMLFFVQGLGKVLCPIQFYFTVEEVSKHKAKTNLDPFVSYNGYVFDIAGYDHPGVSILGAAGTDISGYFPRVDPDTGVPFSSDCDFLAPFSDFTPADLSKPNHFAKRGEKYRKWSNDTNSYCTDPHVPKSQGYCHDAGTINKQIKSNHMGVYQVGVLAFPFTELHRRHYTADDWWIAVDGKIYDMSLLSSPVSNYTIDPNFFALEDFGGPGNSDATKNASTLNPQVLRCFDNLLLVGFVDQRQSSAACESSSYILYGVTGVMVGIMVIKFLAALQLAPAPNPEGNDRFVIMQVPCYNEGESSLTKTIESLATFDYDDTRKLLFIVSDGMIKSAGSDMSTPDLVMQILGVDKKVQQPEAKSYLAIGRGLKEHNKAKVYSGLYSIHARYIPFIFVMKCGKEGETAKPGNRGKRDSQMILMKFLNRVNFGTPMSPLELEMYHHIKNIIGVDPFLYEYCLMVDADTRCEPASLNKLISAMVNDANMMGICGETRIENENESWVTMMQVYEYYISHHLAKAFESLFGSVTCLPGCFCMYRLRTPKKIPLLISNQILNEYKNINVNTLHQQNLLSLGEDRFLTTLMLKHFPEYRNKFTPDAMCYTIVPDTFSMLLGQRRRWINSTIHNLFELIFLPTLCGCLCLSLRLVIFLDLFATLIMPASTAYLGYLIYASVMANQAPIISLIMMGSAYGLQAIIFLVKGQYQHIGWMIISILAMPVFSFYIPLYAYWHFDDFKWGNTRKGAAAETGGGHGTGTDDEELIPLDPSVVPLVTWEAYEASMMLKQTSNSLDSTNTITGSNTKMVAPSSRNIAHAPSPYDNGHQQQYSQRHQQVDISTPQLAYIPNGRPMDSVQYINAHQRISVANPRTANLNSDNSDRWVTQSVEVMPTWTGGVPVDDDITCYIRYIIATTDLSQLSKKKVREAVNVYFGMDLSHKKAFINDVVELLIQG
ncbi:chitin synthase-domain-containing protein [Chytriomyces cf. hyalinus JEL632]|nr:chitin synthase-domain-containing protein [Chytriomyces cf. hyalinus JEL632]